VLPALFLTYDALVAEELPAVLAIDGGNTKTDVALVGADGTLLAQIRGGRSNPHILGLQPTFVQLGELVQEAARTAGVQVGGDGLVASHASVCLAGVDLPDEENLVGGVAQEQGWARSTVVLNDTFAVLRAGLDDADGVGTAGATGAGAGDAGTGDVRRWGVGVNCGAGLNCVGVAPSGETTRFLALGDVSGDWGGGGSLATGALWWAVRAEDGRGPETELRTAVPAHFGLTEVREVTINRVLKKITFDDLYGLVPVLFDVARRGDRVARDLVLRQADEICVMAVTAARRLGLTDTPMPVVLGGSILTARDPLLTQAITARLAADLPQATPRIVDIPPIAGAALLGLDHVGAPAGAGQRLRASFPPPGTVSGAVGGPGGTAGLIR
jgi:N-acetylglucosamine kinase-like BadF-type ATPase